jgi:hypothetical protein
MGFSVDYSWELRIHNETFNEHLFKYHPFSIDNELFRAGNHNKKSQYNVLNIQNLSLYCIYKLEFNEHPTSIIKSITTTVCDNFPKFFYTIVFPNDKESFTLRLCLNVWISVLLE